MKYWGPLRSAYLCCQNFFQCRNDRAVVTVRVVDVVESIADEGKLVVVCLDHQILKEDINVHEGAVFALLLGRIGQLTLFF